MKKLLTMITVIGLFFSLSSIALAAETVVDDAVKGTEMNQFNFDSGWTPYEDAGGTIGVFKNTLHYSNIQDAVAEIKFNGTGISLYAQKDPDKGIAAVSIDGGSETLVDLYADPASNGDLMVWETGKLASGDHTLKVRVTNTKNEKAKNTYLLIDKVVISSAGDSTAGATTANPKTGDSGVSIYILLALVAIAGIIAAKKFSARRH